MPSSDPPSSHAAALLHAAPGVAALQARARAHRMAREAAVSDTVVVSPPRTAVPDGVEAQTVSALRDGRLDGLVRDGRGRVRVDVVGQLDQSVVIRANDPLVRAVRRTSPGLRIFPVTWLYPQVLRSVGDDLAELAAPVQPAGRGRGFTVRVTDTAGRALAGVGVRVLFDWEGTHAAFVSDARGECRPVMPAGQARVEAVFVEPEHTHWPRFVPGFDRAEAPRRLDVGLTPLLPDPFGLLDAYAAHDPTAGEGVTVGVVDSGVGPHAALAVDGGRCLVTGEDPDDHLDNGIGHGTHVAGIIAARRGAGGMGGVAPACRLRSYRVCPRTGVMGRAQSVDVAAAIERAIADGCDLVNISLGSVEPMPEVPDLLQKARDAGVVVFAATGNDGQPFLRYPARESHTLAVAALGRDGTLPADSPETFQRGEVVRGREFVAAFSNHGLGTEFIGPGVGVISTFPGDRFAMMSGTSMSTPFTTGMAARLLSRTPEVLKMARGPGRADAIVRLLAASARRPGWADVYGSFGVVKA